MSRSIALVVAVLAAGVAVAASMMTSRAAQQSGIAPTRVARFVVPAVLPERTRSGECWTGSIAASYRGDAFRCNAGDAIFDPCFVAGKDRVLCDPDPRDPKTGTVLTLAAALPAAPPSQPAGNQAWFFELADGSTCQPLTGTRRDVQGTAEMYVCRFAGLDADAVLGDLDNSGPVWTIEKASLNKKVEPVTVKSATTAPVKSVWQ